jgi:hypothetical protein
VEDGDQETERVTRAIESQTRAIESQTRAIGSDQKAQKRHELASLATTVATGVTALIAVIAFVLSAWVYYGSAKREADVAASEALMRHFEYAAQHPKPKSKLIAKHGIYTANIIVDLTEAPGERSAWRSTAQSLLKDYEGYIHGEDFTCAELDGEFVNLVEKTLLDTDLCPNGGTPPPGGLSRSFGEEKLTRAQMPGSAPIRYAFDAHCYCLTVM